MVYKNKEGEIIKVTFPKRRSQFIIPEFLGEYQCISIGPEEFTTWDGLTEVIIPESVSSIGGWTFSGCHNLTNIEMPKSLTKIGTQAFAGCNKLTSINIPEGVTSIGHGAFYGCNKLANINIPKTVTNIEWDAFYGCTNLDVTIDNLKNNIKVEENAFKNCKSVKWLKKIKKN